MSTVTVEQVGTMAASVTILGAIWGTGSVPAHAWRVDPFRPFPPLVPSVPCEFQALPLVTIPGQEHLRAPQGPSPEEVPRQEHADDPDLWDARLFHNFRQRFRKLEALQGDRGGAKEGRPEPGEEEGIYHGAAPVNGSRSPGDRVARSCNSTVHFHAWLGGRIDCLCLVNGEEDSARPKGWPESLRSLGERGDSMKQLHLKAPLVFFLSVSDGELTPERWCPSLRCPPKPWTRTRTCAGSTCAPRRSTGQPLVPSSRTCTASCSLRAPQAPRG